MDSLSGYVCVPPLQDLTSYQGYLLAFDLGSLANNLVSVFEGGYPGGSDGKKKKKNLPAMQETQVSSLGQKDPLQTGLATHSSILA